MSSISDLAFVTDFDGTITEEDFFVYVQQAFLERGALAPWWEYREGKISHFCALQQIYKTIRVPEAELIELVNKIPICPWVVPTFELLANAKVPIYIASAGCDYYIRILFGAEIEKFKVTLVTNSAVYSLEDGLYMRRPDKTHPFYCGDVGISKAGIVRHLQDMGKTVIFAGDGPPDIEPARIADTVFARKSLLQACISEGIKTETFDSYENIYEFFKRELQK